MCRLIDWSLVIKYINYHYYSPDHLYIPNSPWNMSIDWLIDWSIDLCPAENKLCIFMSKPTSIIYIYVKEENWGLRGRDSMVVGYTTTYAISAYHHWCCDFKSQSGRGVQYYVIKFVCDLRQVGGFLRVLLFPTPIKLTATMQLKYYWKWR